MLHHLDLLTTPILLHQSGLELWKAVVHTGQLSAWSLAWFSPRPTNIDLLEHCSGVNKGQELFPRAMWMQLSCFGPVYDGGDALRSAELATGLASATSGLYHEPRGIYRAHELPLEQQEEQASPYHCLSNSHAHTIRCSVTF